MDLTDVRKEISQIQRFVQSASGALAVRIRAKTPKRTGDLISGIIPSPWEENSKYPGKVVRQVYMDAGMNDTFVKVSKQGKRYYYPASQEFGFKISRRTTLTPKQGAAFGYKTRQSRVRGKFFMNDTVIDYIPVFEKNAESLVDKVVAND
jgi:hypothetical protein